MPKEFDFAGWATKNDLRCSDGRVIGRDAFKHCDGTIVPLVWNHGHTEMRDVIGHALLENREQGVYAYCSFNDTEDGQIAKKIVKHGDVRSLSIYANHLKHDKRTVVHGDIKEVSLVLAGANPGATIEVLAHGEDPDDVEEMVISTGEGLFLEHSDGHQEGEGSGEGQNPDNSQEGDQGNDEGSQNGSNNDPANNEGQGEGSNDDPNQDPQGNEVKHSDGGNSKMDDRTVGDVLKTFNKEQTDVLNYLVGNALEEGQKAKGGNDNMAHNLFEGEQNNDRTVLSHSDLEAIAQKAKSLGSYREAFNAYCEDNDFDASSLEHADYGMENIGYLFPEARAINNVPNFIKRDMGWVDKVMNAVHTTPFARVKSLDAKITEDEARAKGYLKGKLKKEEVFSLLKRTTDPQTVYKKQKFDRDDIIDITDFDVIAWVKAEMKMMLNEEIARAVLIGDGRLESSEDKISTDHIRPVAMDAELYTIQAEVTVPQGGNKYVEFIDECVRSRKKYKGSGNPTLFCTEDALIECMLIKDQIGHRLYKTDAELAMAMRVKEIVTVPVMENVKAKDGTNELIGVIVNLTDYNIGTNKGGQTTFFDDFDIDFNQYKYLIETRLSGALVKPYSAIALFAAAA